ncbi:heterokaryon incompatibility protein-domain-containing protein, partial [Usnea florida]
WLHECESRHGPECNQHGWAIAMEKPKFLRVIDVQDYCIKSVTASTNCRYIALSYVWGRAKMVKLLYSNMESLTRKDGLLEVMDNLPQTITDAIEVVKAMGERYLWTDALCILQENTEESLEQISYMDRVFSGAICTIVAAQGATANSGIEGI